MGLGQRDLHSNLIPFLDMQSMAAGMSKMANRVNWWLLPSYRAVLGDEFQNKIDAFSSTFDRAAFQHILGAVSVKEYILPQHADYVRECWNKALALFERLKACRRQNGLANYDFYRHRFSHPSDVLTFMETGRWPDYPTRSLDEWMAQWRREAEVFCWPDYHRAVAIKHLASEYLDIIPTLPKAAWRLTYTLADFEAPIQLYRGGESREIVDETRRIVPKSGKASFVVDPLKAVRGHAVYLLQDKDNKLKSITYFQSSPMWLLIDSRYNRPVRWLDEGNPMRTETLGGILEAGYE